MAMNFIHNKFIAKVAIKSIKQRCYNQESVANNWLLSNDSYNIFKCQQIILITITKGYVVFYVNIKEIDCFV